MERGAEHSGNGRMQEDPAVYGDQLELIKEEWYAYGRIPHMATEHIDFIGRNAFCVYCALMRFADRATGVCWPSVEMLMQMTGLSRRALFRELARLSTLGMITRTQMRKNQKYGSNRYHMVNPQHWQFAVDGFYECHTRHSGTKHVKPNP